MQTINKDYKEFPSLQSETLAEGEYNIRHKVYRQLYTFFDGLKGNDDTIWIINISDSVSHDSVYDTDAIEIYNDFGIYFTNNNDLLSIRDPIRKLLIIPKEATDSMESFKAFYSSTIESELEMDYTDVIFEIKIADDGSESSFGYVDYLTDLLDSTGLVLNVINEYPVALEVVQIVEENLESIREYTIGGKKVFKLENIGPELYKVMKASSQYNKAITEIVNYIEEFKSRKVSTRIVYYCEIVGIEGVTTSDIKAVNYLYSSVAAYLNVKYGYSFYISNSVKPFYLQNQLDLFSNLYTSLHYYLEMLSNPLDAGIYFSGNRAYFCALDLGSLVDVKTRRRSYERYYIRPTFIAVPFNTEEKKLDTSNGSTVIMDMLQNIAVIDYKNFYDIAQEDKTLALEELKQLNMLFAKFENTLIASSRGVYDKHNVLTVFNCTFFRYKGRTYLGYMSSLDGRYPYVVKPLTDGYPQFKKDLEVDLLQSVRPLSTMFLYDRIFGGGQSKSYNGKIDIPDSALGVILTGMSYVIPEKITEDCVLNLEQIGTWSPVSTSLRREAGAKVLENVPGVSMRINNNITCFGGPHPYITSEITLRNDTWRNLNV